MPSIPVHARVDEKGGKTTSLGKCGSFHAHIHSKSGAVTHTDCIVGFKVGFQKKKLAAPDGSGQSSPRNVLHTQLSGDVSVAHLFGLVLISLRS